MADKIHGFLPASAEMPSTNQRLFARYFTGVLIDLVVLNLFDEFSDKVTIDSFSISLLAAIVLQLLLKLTMAAEHWVAAFFNQRPGAFMKFLRFFGAWLVLFGSKFLILEAISLLFGDSVRFEGRLDGLVTVVIVVLTMVIVEEVVVRIYRRIR